VLLTRVLTGVVELVGPGGGGPLPLGGGAEPTAAGGPGGRGEGRQQGPAALGPAHRSGQEGPQGTRRGRRRPVKVLGEGEAVGSGRVLRVDGGAGCGRGGRGLLGVPAGGEELPAVATVDTERGVLSDGVALDAASDVDAGP